MDHHRGTEATKEELERAAEHLRTETRGQIRATEAKLREEIARLGGKMHAMEAKLREEAAGLREQLHATKTKLGEDILAAKARLRGQIDRVELPSRSKPRRSRPISSSGRSPSGWVTCPDKPGP